MGNERALRAIGFSGFVLDLDRAELRNRAGEPVKLRAKTRALLAYLLEHAGRVASREDILAAVWPGITASDESLSQAIAELRRALGCGGRTPLIRTVHRLGYMLDVIVSDASGEPPASFGAGATWPERATTEARRSD